ncbi:MAG: SGNH/GDSL hydrolase family protein [Clostridia bacterium]|nr:SGNH/GDSL hydrolase family protein [Clostridia bacterium]
MKKILAFLLTAVMLMGALSVFAAAANLTFNTGITPDPEGPLYKKSVLFVGDSITEGRVEWNKGKNIVGWPGRIIEGNKMSGANKGVSGASISNCRNANTVIAQLQNESGKTYDFVIMHGGVNDAWDVAPIGTMTEGFDAELDLSTFAGGLEATFKYAKETFKDAQFGYIINFKINRADVGKLADMSEYFDMAKQICDKWEIPYLDLYSDEDFNNNVLKYKEYTNLYDLIHPSSAGFDVLAPVISDWMKTIPAYYEELNKPEEESVDVSEAASEAVSEAVSEDASIAEPTEDNSGLIIYIVCGAVIVIAIAVAVIVVIKKRK